MNKLWDDASWQTSGKSNYWIIFILFRNSSLNENKTLILFGAKLTWKSQHQLHLFDCVSTCWSNTELQQIFIFFLLSTNRHKFTRKSKDDRCFLSLIFSFLLYFIVPLQLFCDFRWKSEFLFPFWWETFQVLKSVKKQKRWGHN